MTSVAVVSSAVERMKGLTKLENSGSLPMEAKWLLNDLEDIQGLLAAAYYHEVELGGKLEKEVVRISYDIIYTITDALKVATTTRIFDQLRISGGRSKFKILHGQLQCFMEDLFKKVHPDKTAGLIPDPDSSATGQTIMNVGEMKPKSTADLKIQGEDMAAGSDERPADHSMSASKSIIEDRTDLLDLLKSILMSNVSEDSPREMYIMGKGGVGKSTLARQLYNDHKIRKAFDVLGWVTVGHNFQIKQVLELVLKQLGGPQLNRGKMNQIEIISEIFDVVGRKSYLLVLEDIGSAQDWECIHIALPLANPTCRVIITTSSEEFRYHPNCHRIFGLSHSETLASLNKETSFGPEVGDAISHISGGLPLYVTILQESVRWGVNNKNLVEELRSYESVRGTHHVIGACYKRLPLALKPCFLYLGQFPPSHDIPVAQLYLLLEAENLIMLPRTGDAKISPQTLMDNLNELSVLMLVQVEEDPRSETGLYKSCRLHDQVREFCNSQGLDEEFHQVVDFERSTQLVDPYTHRLAIYMKSYKGDASIRFCSNDTARKILSLLIFDAFDSAEEKPGWPSEMDDLAGFDHLRVLIFEEVNFKLRKFPMGLEKLLFLSFLSFRGCFLEELPSYLGSLKQLETLDLVVREECNVRIQGNIFPGMKRMVHLFLPRRYHGKGKMGAKLSLAGMRMVETLVNFDTEVFNVEDLQQLKELRTLSTLSNGECVEKMVAVVNLLNEREEDVQHSSVEITSFDCYNHDSILALRKLLQCEFVHSVKVEGQILQLPVEGGGGRVAEIVFQGSKLDLKQDPMEYFGKFQNLRSLTLANEAFIGGQIVIPPVPLFPKLKSLKLQNLQYLERLTIEEGALPQLSSLQVESCGSSLELTIPQKLYHRLKRKSRGGGYSVVPLPSKIQII